MKQLDFQLIAQVVLVSNVQQQINSQFDRIEQIYTELLDQQLSPIRTELAAIGAE
jgi:hypothetical protein